MTTTWALPTLAIAAALSLTACAGSTEASPEPAVTTTVTATASPEPAVTESVTRTITVTESPEPAATSEEEVVGDSDLAGAALDLTWNEMTYTEQESLCYGWNLLPTTSLDVFMENSEGFISREQAKTFFDTKCEDF